MITHNMKLNDEAFRTISSGIKKIELRLYDDKRRLVRPGDNIIFTCGDKALTALVLGISISDSFANLCKIIYVPDTGWRDAAELTTGMLKYYTAAEQIKHGVVGIHLQKIK